MQWENANQNSSGGKQVTLYVTLDGYGKDGMIVYSWYYFTPYAWLKARKYYQCDDIEVDGVRFRFWDIQEEHLIERMTSIASQILSDEGFRQ